MSPTQKETTVPLPRDGGGMLRTSKRRASYSKTAPKSRRPTEPPNQISVYAGLVRLGDIEPVEGRWRALTVDGELIDEFPTSREAAAAVIGGAA